MAPVFRVGPRDMAALTPVGSSCVRQGQARRLRGGDRILCRLRARFVHGYLAARGATTGVGRMSVIAQRGTPYPAKSAAAVTSLPNVNDPGTGEWVSTS